MAMERPDPDPARPTPPAGPRTGRCVASGQEHPLADLMPVALLRSPLVERLRAERGEVPPDALISRPEVERLRTQHITALLQDERGELGALEREVLESLARQDIVSDNVETSIEEGRSAGERLADRLASFGGSWAFLASFALVLAVWMGLNLAEDGRAFDPYPFILLNLVLSCLAAVQAPVIMMSQRRQEAKDRLRSLNDYRVNLKAELEIRHLHEKIDHMLTRQWERLAEMQEVQIEILQDLARSRAPGP
jgi:uncharacterized membrane protein